MKLFIQIPCYNEENDIINTLNKIPRTYQGIDNVEILVINDGSTDNTLKLIKDYGIKHIINLPFKQGLSNAFKTGIDYCLENGADIIVNTDADNQYDSNFIKDLLSPILDNKADIVIGARDFSKIKNFSKTKIFFQNFGSKVISLLSSTNIKDATSGFRSFSKNAAQSLNIFNDFTYTHESIIQASYNNFRILSVPIKTNEVTRRSRLFNSNLEYIFKSMIVILKVFVIYKPFKFFFLLSIPFFLTGIFLEIQWLSVWIQDRSIGLIPRLFLGAFLILISILFLIAGLFSGLIAVNRKILENIKKKLNR